MRKEEEEEREFRRLKKSLKSKGLE